MIKEDGVPIIATDPWLIGSAYWRSWWLEKYPTKEEIEDVRRSENVYVTHFIRVDTKVSTKFTYGFFLLMGLHDYRHFNSLKDWINFVRFYTPHGLPFFFRVRELFSLRKT